MSELALDPATVAELRDLTERIGFPDAYTVLRAVRQPDGQGGTVLLPDQPVESGFCRIDTTGLQPEERETARRLGWSVAYAVDMPLTTGLKASDKLRVNGRRTFHVQADPAKGENFGISARALVKEVG